MFLFVGAMHGGDSLPSEFLVRARFLINFAKYVEWPAETFSAADAPILIGVLGKSPCVEELHRVSEGKKVSGRRILIRQIAETTEVRQCQILFIADPEKRRVDEALRKAWCQPILTVGEGDPFAQDEGMIGFVKRDGKVRLVINLQTSRRARLEISSQLLTLADHVIGKP